MNFQISQIIKVNKIENLFTSNYFIVFMKFKFMGTFIEGKKLAVSIKFPPEVFSQALIPPGPQKQTNTFEFYFYFFTDIHIFFQKLTE